jgi:acetamidase/formamidase
MLDLREATRSAVRHMIEFLCAEYKLDRVDAYMLCSIAADLRLHEVVRRSLEQLKAANKDLVG